MCFSGSSGEYIRLFLFQYCYILFAVDCAEPYLQVYRADPGPWGNPEDLPFVPPSLRGKLAHAGSWVANTDLALSCLSSMVVEVVDRPIKM